jgi:RNase P/RNase MRP subunit p29
MKTKISLLLFVLTLTLLIHAQTNQDTTVVTLKTVNGGAYSGQIIFESPDSVKINTKDFGIITIAQKNIIRENLVTIETMDGNEFLGEIVSEDSNSVKLKTIKFGEITITKSDIKKRSEVKVQQIKDGKYWFPNPQSTRYFWSPNGYGLKKGEGYYQNIWVLWNQFSYGVSDNFSIGGGIIPIFLLGAPTPVFATMKFSIPVKENKVNIAGGAILGYVIGESEAGLGILYGLSTFGTPDNNVTVGMGYGFAGGEWAKSPMINVNGMFRVSSRGYFITENYIIAGGDVGAVILSLGGRSIIKKAALDYGLILPLSADFDGFIALPWLGFTIPFGKTD